eukprot:838050-Amorphochlora_amoeboformis.AAC.1
MECFTCGLTEDRGVCQICAETCHAGHDLSEEHYSSFFCDCGAEGRGRCQSLPDDTNTSERLEAIPQLKYQNPQQIASTLLLHNCDFLKPRAPYRARLQMRSKVFRVVTKRRAQAAIGSSSPSASASLPPATPVSLDRPPVYPFKKTGPAPLPGAPANVSFVLAALNSCIDQLVANPTPPNHMLSYLDAFVGGLEPLSVVLPVEHQGVFEKISRLYQDRAIGGGQSQGAEAEGNAMR